jgi:tetratricopeptide (TPR) repeat protein
MISRIAGGQSAVTMASLIGADIPTRIWVEHDLPDRPVADRLVVRRHTIAMRYIHRFCLVMVIAAGMSLPSAGTAQTDPDADQFARASAAFNRGDAAGALAQVERLLTNAPENQNALYLAALINLRLGNADAARGRLERVVKLAGNNFDAWQLMVQVTQAQGDLVRRDGAIDRLKLVIKTAIDPDIRNRIDFIRDRIPIGDHALLAIDYFERGGSDFTRYQFSVDDAGRNQQRGLLLRTDAETTENWRDTALMPPDKPLFHLDLVDPRPEGGYEVAIYQFYVDEPPYDMVRADVLKILRGEARPLSGQSGSLAGILTR